MPCTGPTPRLLPLPPLPLLLRNAARRLPTLLAPYRDVAPASSVRQPFGSVEESPKDSGHKAKTSRPSSPAWSPAWLLLTRPGGPLLGQAPDVPTGQRSYQHSFAHCSLDTAVALVAPSEDGSISSNGATAARPTHTLPGALGHTQKVQPHRRSGPDVGQKRRQSEGCPQTGEPTRAHHLRPPSDPSAQRYPTVQYRHGATQHRPEALQPA